MEISRCGPPNSQADQMDAPPTIRSVCRVSAVRCKAVSSYSSDDRISLHLPENQPALNIPIFFPLERHMLHRLDFLNTHLTTNSNSSS